MSDVTLRTLTGPANQPIPGNTEFKIYFDRRGYFNPDEFQTALYFLLDSVITKENGDHTKHTIKREVRGDLYVFYTETVDGKRNDVAYLRNTLETVSNE
jgi:hypothetical protein